MKKELLVTVFMLIAGSLAAQQLVLGSHDVVRLNEYPQNAYLIEADASGFFRVSGAYSTSTDHPLLGSALDPDYRSIYFIKYDKEGVALKSNFIRGTNYASYAASFNGGFTVMAGADQEVDASGTIIPIPNASEVEFIANYDSECQLEKIINIWALTDNQYVDSDAILDPEDGSVYIYGTANFPLTLGDGGILGQGLSASYFYLIKYDRNLDRQWFYQFGFDMMQSGTSPYFDKVQVYPGINGEVLITGTYGTESSPLIDGISLPAYMDGYGTFAVLLNASSQPKWVLDGSLNDFGYASRIFKAFPMPNGDFVLAGNTNTGFYRLGSAVFTFLNSQANNQFVFRVDPMGNPVWTRQFESQGPVQEGKKKSTSSEVLNSNVFYDAITWKNRLLYMAAPFMNPAFSVASEVMNLVHPSGLYVAAVDLLDGTEVWGYALSSNDVSLHGFDVDRSGNVSLMGSNFATQNLDGLTSAAVVDGSFLFHLGLDYNGKALWYTNASLATPPYYDLGGIDLEVLSNGEVFSSLRMNAANEIVLGESRVSDAASQSSWVVELASDVILGGIVSDASDNPVYPGYVKAIKSTWWGRYPEVDTAFLQDDGSYLFDDLYPGNYTLLAVPDPDFYPNAICTYMGDRTGWLETPFYNLVPKFNSTSMNIKLTELDPLSPGEGSGEMFGEISLEGDMDDALKGTLARPAKKAAVVLLKKTKKSTMAGEVVAFTETDESGMFSFTNVPDGEYLLHVEVPGLEMLEMHDVSIVGNQLIAGLNYTIGEDGIYIGWPTGISLLENETLSVYPNPGSGLIIMDLPAAGDYEVKIFSMDGRMVLQEQFTSAGGARSIDLSRAGDGTYLIQVKGPETDVSTRYIKK